MRWKPHVRFGGRAGETHPPKGGQGAPVRSHGASQALHVVRRWVWNLLRRMDLPGHAKQLKNCRYACGRTPRTSPCARPPSWPGSPVTTTVSTGPTC